MCITRAHRETLCVCARATCARPARAPYDPRGPQCFGLLMAVYGLGSIDFIFVSKTMEAMGVDSAPGLFWLAIQAATTALIFL